LCVRACRRPDELAPPVARTEFQRRGGTGCVVLSVAESALVETSETLLARRTSSGLYSAAAPFSGIRWCVFVAIWWRGGDNLVNCRICCRASLILRISGSSKLGVASPDEKPLACQGFWPNELILRRHPRWRHDRPGWPCQPRNQPGELTASILSKTPHQSRQSAMQPSYQPHPNSRQGDVTAVSSEVGKAAFGPSVVN